MTARLEWHGDQVLARMRRGGARALRRAAEHVLEEANRTVPHDEGTLLRSGFVDVDDRRLEAVVAYDTPYAARQHEERTWQHAPGRRAKWLELTVQERTRAIRHFMWQEMSREIGR